MADNYLLEVKIKGDAGDLIREMGRAGAASKTLDNQLKSVGGNVGGGRVTSNMAAMKAAMVSTGAAAMSMAEQHGAAMSRVGTAALGAGAALTATAGMAVKAANDWESAWAGVTKTVDGADTALENSLRGLAKTLPSSHEEIAAVAEAAGQLNVAKSDVTSFTKTMIDLGQSTNLSADEAATQIARFNNIMGLSNKQASNLGSTLVDLGNTNATTEAEIMAMSMRIAATGKQVKMTAPDILALSASLTSVGVGAEAGGTAMSKFLSKMDTAVSTGNSDLELMAKTAGMSGDQFKKAFQEDAAGAFAAFEKGLGKMIKSGEGATQLMADLGINQAEMRRALMSLSLDAEGFANNIGQASKAWAENKALIEEANKRYATAESRMAMARNRIVDAAIDMGQAIAPAVADIVEGLSRLVEGFTSLPGPVKSAVGVLTAFGGGSLLAVGAVAKLLPMIVELKNAAAELGMLSAFSGFGGHAGAVLGSLESKIFARRATGKAATIAAAKAESAVFQEVLATGASVATAELLATKAANESLAKSTRPVTGALKKAGSALAGVATAAVPVAGEVTAIGAAAVAASVGIAAGAAKLGDFASGAKKINEATISLQSKISNFKGKNFTETFFGDTSKVQDAGVQYLNAVNNINAFNPLNIRTTDESNAIERLKNLDSTLANTGIAGSATTIRSALRSLGGIDTEHFDRLMEAMPEYSKALDETAKRSGAAADSATKLKIATGEIVEVQDAAGKSALATANDIEQNRNAYGDLIPTTKEGVESMMKVIDANTASAASFIDIGQSAEQGLAAWHDAMMKQGKATQEWASNMIQARAGGLSEAALAGLKELGPKGALILQQATDQMRAGSLDGLKQIEEAFGVGGAGAAQTFGEAFSSQAVAAVMAAAYAKGPEVGKAVADAISAGTTDLNSLVSQYDLQVNVSADTLEAYGKVDELKTEIESGTNIVHITATDAEARAALAQLGIDVDATTGTVTIAGNPAPADATLGELVGNIDASTGTVKINGNTYDAKMTVEEFIAYAVDQKPSVKVKALTGEAEGAIAQLTRTRTMNILAKVFSSGNTAGYSDAVISGGKRRPGRAHGGYISGPGTSTSDSIPAWLSNGEFVMRAAAVRKYGTDFMHRINENRFASGGPVGSARFATDPKKWEEMFDRAATQLSNSLAVTSTSTNISAAERFVTGVATRTQSSMNQVNGYLAQIASDTAKIASRGGTGGSHNGSSYGKRNETAEDKAEREAEQKKQAERTALREYEQLTNTVSSYTKKITDAFETFTEIRKLLAPVEARKDSKGRVTDKARAAAGEKTQNNFERAVEKLIRLQETLGGLYSGASKTWQVKGRERSYLDENGKPTVWNVGGAINKNASREQVNQLLSFLTTAFKGMLTEVGTVKGIAGRKTSPLEIMKMLGWDYLGNIKSGKDQDYPVLSASIAKALAGSETGKTLPLLVPPVKAIADSLKQIELPMKNSPKVTRSGDVTISSVEVGATQALNTPPVVSGPGDAMTMFINGMKELNQTTVDTYTKLMGTRISVTPDVQVVNVDDIQANVRIIVRTKLDYSDLQQQAETAAHSVHPPAVIIPVRLGEPTM